MGRLLVSKLVPGRVGRSLIVVGTEPIGFSYRIHRNKVFGFGDGSFAIIQRMLENEPPGDAHRLGDLLYGTAPCVSGFTFHRAS